MKHLGLPLLALSILLLGACAKPQTALRTEYQAKANQILSNVTRGVSNAFVKPTSSRGVRGTASTTSSVVYGNWNVYGSQPYGGYLISNNQNQNIQRCVELLSYIPETVEAFDIMTATGLRCLAAITQYRNPLNTFAMSNLNSSGADMAGYLQSYALGGQYQAGAGYGSAMLPWLNTGTTGGSNLLWPSQAGW